VRSGAKRVDNCWPIRQVRVKNVCSVNAFVGRAKIWRKVQNSNHSDSPKYCHIST